jgi:hypothetical protein
MAARQTFDVELLHAALSTPVKLRDRKTGAEEILDPSTLSSELIQYMNIAEMTPQGSEVKMTGFGCVSKDGIFISQEFGLYTPQSFQKKIDELLDSIINGVKSTHPTLTSEAIKGYIEAKTDYKPGSLIWKYKTSKQTLEKIIMLGYWDENNTALKSIKQKFKECATANYFYLPITSFPLNGALDVPYHANGIFINKAKGSFIRFEPQQTAGNPFLSDETFNKGLINLVNEVGLRQPQFKELLPTCPQGITLDRNCIFWTLYMYKAILQNITKDPNDVIASLSQGKTKEELTRIITEFKINLATKAIPFILNYIGKDWVNYGDRSILHERIEAYKYNKLTKEIEDFIKDHPLEEEDEETSVPSEPTTPLPDPGQAPPLQRANSVSQPGGYRKNGINKRKSIKRRKNGNKTKHRKTYRKSRYTKKART